MDLSPLLLVDGHSIESNTTFFTDLGKGEDEELAISKLLWDLTDLENEPGDTKSDDPRILYSFLVANKPQTFEQFCGRTRQE